MSAVAVQPALSWRQEAQLGLLGLCGGGLLWATLSRHGVGLSPDSVGYLTVARHIVEGAGLISYRGEPFVSQPPLYPLALAGVMRLFSLEDVAAALRLNLTLHALVIYLSGKLSFAMTGSFGSAVTTCLSVLVGVPMFEVSVFAWSELLFICFLTTHLIFINSFALSRKNKYLFLSAAVAGLACMTRYAGVTIIFSSLIFISLLYAGNFRAALNKSAVFFSVSSLPLIIWVIRNHILSDTFFGPRSSSILNSSQVLILFGDVLLDWFIYPSAKLEPTTWVLSSLATTLVFFVFLSVRLRRSIQSGKFAYAYPIIFTLAYSAFIIFSSSRVFYDPIDHRLLSPCFIPLIISALCFFFTDLRPMLSTKPPVGYRRLAAPLVAVVWFTYPSIATMTFAAETYQNGQGYHSVHWERSETVEYVRRHQAYFAHQPIYANDPEGLYFTTRLRARHFPFQVRAPWPETEQAYLVRFRYAHLGWYANQFEQLKNVADLTLLAELSDGEIYFAKRRQK